MFFASSLATVDPAIATFVAERTGIFVDLAEGLNLAFSAMISTAHGLPAQSGRSTSSEKLSISPSADKAWPAWDDFGELLRLVDCLMETCSPVISQGSNRAC